MRKRKNKHTLLVLTIFTIIMISISIVYAILNQNQTDIKRKHNIKFLKLIKSWKRTITNRAIMYCQCKKNLWKNHLIFEW